VQNRVWCRNWDVSILKWWNGKKWAPKCLLLKTRGDALISVVVKDLRLKDEDEDEDLKIAPRGSSRTRTFLEDNNTGADGLYTASDPVVPPLLLTSDTLSVGNSRTIQPTENVSEEVNRKLYLLGTSWRHNFQLPTPTPSATVHSVTDGPTDRQTDANSWSYCGGSAERYVKRSSYWPEHLSSYKKWNFTFDKVLVHLWQFFTTQEQKWPFPNFG